MEDFKHKSEKATEDREIIFSQAIKAGKRIYYVDVKRDRRDEMFLSITESKKIVSDNVTDPHVSFEKHKIFLYQEDFDKFLRGLHQAIDFIRTEKGEAQTGRFEDWD